MIEVGQIWANNFNKYLIVEIDEERKFVCYIDTYGDSRTTLIAAFEDYMVYQAGCRLVTAGFADGAL